MNVKVYGMTNLKVTAQSDQSTRFTLKLIERCRTGFP